VDEFHGFVEGKTENLREKVDGITGEIAFWPAPERVFYDETMESRQSEVTPFARDELETAFLKQRNERGEACGADLLAGPAGFFTIERAGYHSFFSSGVE
jgi:hypothetical protein